MKVLLLTPPGQKNFMRNARWDTMGISGSQWYPIWLAYCTGLLEKKGHECKLIDAQVSYLSCWQIQQLTERFKPDLTVVYFSTRTLADDLAFCGKISYFSKIALVGPSASLIDKEKIMANKYISYIIEGEFDYPVLNLANNKHPHEILGLTWRTELDNVVTNQPSTPVPSEGLETFPFVTDVYRRHLKIGNYHQTAHRYPFIDLFTGRGCSYGLCSFCLWPNTICKGAGYRTRSIDNVIEELKFINTEMPEIKEIFLQDDTLPEWRAIELSEAILKSDLKIRWSCYSRANLKYETLKLMKQSGCRTMHVGYESSAPQILKNIKKGVTVEQMEEFTCNANKAELFIVADFVTGLPGETEDTIKATVKWAQRLPVQRYTITLPKPYMNTPFYEYLKENNLLDKDGHPVYEGLTPEQMYKWNKWSVKQVYLNPRYLLRMLRHPGEWLRLARSAMYLRPFLKKNECVCEKDNLEW
jgi:anaerobic magnesium-protoporphyrin IX monomethyl ester cyclase